MFSIVIEIYNLNITLICLPHVSMPWWVFWQRLFREMHCDMRWVQYIQWFVWFWVHIWLERIFLQSRYGRCGRIFYFDMYFVCSLPLLLSNVNHLSQRQRVVECKKIVNTWNKYNLCISRKWYKLCWNERFKYTFLAYKRRSGIFKSIDRRCLLYLSFVKY